MLPSVTDLVFILLLVSLTYGRLAPRLLWDGDVGWHIRNGENILSSHAIPTSDSFSATRAGQPWYSWEWLYDVALGWTHSVAGLNGVVFLTAVIIAVTLSLVFRRALLRGTSLPATIFLFVLCLVASSIHFLARPHVVSWFLGMIWFWALEDYERTGKYGAVWLFPSLMMLWVNLHGGFILGFLLLGIFLAGAAAEVVFHRENPNKAVAMGRLKIISLVIAGCAFASLINPYSYKLHAHVYEYLTNRFYMQHIDEFRAPNLRGLPAQAFVLLLVVSVLAIWRAKAKLRPSAWLILIFCAFSGLWAARNIPIAAMLLVCVVAPLVPGKANIAALRDMRLDTVESRFKGHLWPVLVVIFTCGALLAGGRLFHRQVIDAHFDPHRFPVQAVETLAHRGIKDPVFSLDAWGGYLIYSRYPEQRVFIDDRHDFYGEAYLREYLKVLHLEPGWKDILDSWGVNLVVFPAKAKLSTELSKAGWKAIYQDETAAIFARQ